MSGAARESAGGLRGTLRDVVKYTPSGDSIPDEAWRSRHRNILVLLFAHVPFLFALGRFTGTEPYVTGASFTAVPMNLVVVEVGAIVVFALLASWPRLGRRARTAFVALGLLTCSAVLAHFSGGFIEAHFHFFVMVGVVAVYEDWLPFLVAILYVALEHSYFGMVAPGAVYNHPDALANPWGWALVHAVFVLALAGALVSHWMSIERSREEARLQMENAEQSDEQVEKLQEKRAELEAARAEAQEAKANAEARQQDVERLNEQLLARADELATAMDAVSDGDFTVDPPEGTDIEAIEEIGAAYGEMTRELSATIADLRAFAATVEDTTQSVHDDAESLEDTQQELATDIREFATDIRGQADDLEATADDLTNLSATIEEIAANAEEVSAEASTAADAAEAGTQTANEAIEAIEAIEESVGELAALVESLDSRMDDVAESTGLIDDIAEQTNLLALNANIEAARAGEEGDGFAVVADEVKALAEETREHSDAIEGTIEQTVADVDRVQAEMEQTKARIATGEETMTHAGEAFRDLTGTVSEVDASVDEVAAATDDGARTTEEVVDAISRVAERSRTVAERSESLADRAETGATTVSEIRVQLDELAGQTASLQDQLDAFDCAVDANEDEAAAVADTY
ncbi:methyl-accepting chemotaxis protein [Halobacterium sp. R2-5]|uniref:methyl-accepting chemotaxis protein n=1 Tax=Halobacterium sp. R2-5 TaxID=2715751 RepID=UPI0014209000|nr:methyl-accepting chemotaxis protein [Halobacterium sp. R2-5]NIB99880.1 methyl-accepting chemotaxis protein [Halobacterium sp. R2-5]